MNLNLQKGEEIRKYFFVYEITASKNVAINCPC